MTKTFSTHDGGHLRTCGRPRARTVLTGIAVMLQVVLVAPSASAQKFGEWSPAVSIDPGRQVRQHAGERRLPHRGARWTHAVLCVHPHGRRQGDGYGSRHLGGVSWQRGRPPGARSNGCPLQINSGANQLSPPAAREPADVCQHPDEPLQWLPYAGYGRHLHHAASSCSRVARAAAALRRQQHGGRVLAVVRRSRRRDDAVPLEQPHRSPQDLREHHAGRRHMGHAGSRRRLNAGGRVDARPNVRKDGLEIVFSSTRGDPANSNSDIFTSTRANLSQPWSTPRRLGAKSNSADGGIAPLSLSGRHAPVLGSARANATAGGIGTDIFVSTRSGPGKSQP